MIYAADFEQTMIDRAESVIDTMTAWLSDKSPDVWMWFAQHANPDTCTPVLSWMVEQPSCDRAVVATIFWNCEPEHLAQTLIRGEDRSVIWDEEELAELVLLIWRNAPARNSGLSAALNGRDEAYGKALAAENALTDPLSIPAWLFGPFGDRPCGATTDSLLQDHEHLHTMMHDLGVWFGDSPPGTSHGNPNAGAGATQPTTQQILTSETPDEKRWRIAVGVALIGFSVLMGWTLLQL